ncbi:MAG: penicillin-binding protein 1A [Bacteriovoracaceae bacterium]
MSKKIILWGLVGTFLLGVSGAGGFLFYINSNLPKLDKLSDYNPPLPSVILAKDGSVLAKISKENRELINIDEVPEFVINAFLSAEDDGFYEHRGVDIMGVIRALWINIKAGRVVQGGSTITQQVAKSLLLTSERSLIRKMKDFILAIKIEKKLSKKEILYLYLNQVYLGGGYYGIKTAFEGYFGKEMSEATIAEAAMVAGLLVAPGRYSPYIKPHFAKKRQRYVLKRMLATKKISQEEYDEAMVEKIRYRIRRGGEFKAGYFTDWVRQRVIGFVGEKEFLTGGYTVRTTIDTSLQEVAEKESFAGVKAIDKRQGFKGPIRQQEIYEKKNVFGENYLKSLKEKREKLYKARSQFFTVNDSFKKEFELSLGEGEIQEIQDYRNNFYEKMKASFLYPGLHNEEDTVKSLLKKGESVEAVVTAVNNKAKVILVDILGVPGIINKAGFSWAHERIISEKREWYPAVDLPSKVVKVGDVILVKIVSLETGLYRQFDSAYMKRVKATNIYKKTLDAIKEQKFVLCKIDQEPDVQAALMSMSPRSGEIISFVGGSNFLKSQFNRVVQSQRQPGSSFKPLLFAAGLENGFYPNSIIVDSPEALASSEIDVSWKPGNYDGRFKGPMTFRNALEQSRNVPTIKIAQEVGVSKIVDFSKRIGFNAKMDPDLSLSLGAFGATLYDIVTTYAIFPNGGRRIQPVSILEIKDREGQEIQFHEDIEKLYTPQDYEKMILAKNPVKEDVESSPTEDQVKTSNSGEQKNEFLEGLNEEIVYDRRLAYVMSNLLRGIVSSPGGTGGAARALSPYVGGKTGTTSNYVDAWFIGFASNIVTGVWTGFDQNETMGYGEAGSKAALPIWREYMTAALEKLGKFEFQVPPGIVNVYINKDTGKENSAANFLESFVEGYEPGSIETKKEELSEDAPMNLIEEDDYYNSL